MQVKGEIWVVVWNDAEGDEDGEISKKMRMSMVMMW